MTFLEALNKKVLLGDGAIGTILIEKGFDTHPTELVNLIEPELIKNIHKEYVLAGSDVIITNTFRANKIRLGDFHHKLEEINIKGVQLAREVLSEGKYLLGSIGPCGKPIEPIGAVTLDQVYESIIEQAEALLKGDVDGFLLESFIEIEELKTAIKAVRSLSDLPIIASKAYVEDGEALAEGLPMQHAANLQKLNIQGIGANCAVGPQRMLDIVRQLSEKTSLPILAFPTPGLPQLVKGHVIYDISPEYFSKACLRLIEEGAKMIGGCCGTTPEHIRLLRKAMDAKPIKFRAHSTTHQELKEKAPLIESEPTELAQKLGKKFIITVEMDLPRGLNVQKVLRGAKSLKIKGADLIDISDGARARLRMNPLPVSTLIQNQIGIEVMMHFSCRDRNLLAIQADLLGAHALGVRNILAITGDPANIGDYPSATSVFDVDAIGLVRILSRFNEGIDLAGYSIGTKCAFTIAAAYNPLARDPALELDRLKRKHDAGAHIIYTQPLFEESTVYKTLEACSKLNLPVFAGVLPLKNARHADFMHHEVPGIEIPDWLRKRMIEAADDNSGLEIGIEEAQKLAEKIRKMAQGLYLMPPFGNPIIAEKVMDAVV